MSYIGNIRFLHVRKILKKRTGSNNAIREIIHSKTYQRRNLEMLKQKPLTVFFIEISGFQRIDKDLLSLLEFVYINSA